VLLQPGGGSLLPMIEYVWKHFFAVLLVPTSKKSIYNFCSFFYLRQRIAEVLVIAGVCLSVRPSFYVCLLALAGYFKFLGGVGLRTGNIRLHFDYIKLVSQ